MLVCVESGRIDSNELCFGAKERPRPGREVFESGPDREDDVRLFDDAGEPTEFMKGVQSYLEQLDAELQRTRAFCQRLVELDLLQDMRFDAQMEDGQACR